MARSTTTGRSAWIWVDTSLDATKSFTGRVNREYPAMEKSYSWFTPPGFMKVA
jgi:hypothetical protein